MSAVDTRWLRKARASVGAPEFRQAMRELASGVCLITHGEGDGRTGMTATSVASFSTEPPTLIACINRNASLFAQLKRGDAFAVCVLGAQHAEYAQRFAGGAGLQGAERFREGRWALTPAGVSVLAEALAIFECEAEEIIERGTHAIVLGRVSHVASRSDDGALVHWRGDFDRIGWSAEERARVGAAPEDSRPPLRVAR